MAKTHTVERGETLSGIAEKYGLSWTELARINGIKNPHHIEPGWKLKLEEGPSRPPPPSPPAKKFMKGWGWWLATAAAIVSGLVALIYSS